MNLKNLSKNIKGLKKNETRIIFDFNYNISYCEACSTKIKDYGDFGYCPYCGNKILVIITKENFKTTDAYAFLPKIGR